jgi:hypothetical protein
MKKRIPYGIGDFEIIRRENYYYIDKTRIIEELENHRYPFFIRPRRFGKSLLISTLEDYYDVEKKEAFDELFEGLYVHEHPTRERNAYLILRLDFTGIETSMGKERLFDSFTKNVRTYAMGFVQKYKNHFSNRLLENIANESEPAQIIKLICESVKALSNKIYLLIDEYDNFANDLIGANADNLYYEILNKTGFVRTFYEAIKSGAQEGAISRLFMTGVSPIMLDDLTSGFNIASNITLDREFNEALGFTQRDVEALLDYYWTFDSDSELKKESVLREIKTYYNGYLFSKNSGERLYNPDMVLYFMKYLSRGNFPDELIDTNVKTDYGKLQRLLRENRKKGTAGDITSFEAINEKDEIITKIKRMFPLEAITGKEEITSLMYYMGLLTIKEAAQALVKLKVPNLVIKELYWKYLYEKIQTELNEPLDVEQIAQSLQTMSQTGDITDFVTYTYDKVLKYISNRDLMGMEEKHIKMIFLSFLSVNNIYIPYSELELNGGYSDIVLYPDSRYGVQNSHIWELKFLKKNENREKKIQEAGEQILKYERDEKFMRLAKDTKLFKYIILGTKDGVEILSQ